MSEPLVTQESEQAAKDALRDAYQQLADVIHEPRAKHVHVHIFDVGLTCDRCRGSWDGAWESEDHRVCRECVDAIMDDVMGTRQHTTRQEASS